MELYILDNLYRRVRVIDTFESLIWTHNFQAIGDFELKIRSTRDLRDSLRPRVFLGMSKSNRVMVIENVEDRIDDEGDILEVSGRSFELFLDDRILWYARGQVEPWYITTSPIGLPAHLFAHAMNVPDFPYAPPEPFDQNAAIPLLSPRSVPTDPFAVDAGVEEVIDWVQEEPDTLYNGLQKACATYDLGFRIIRDEEDPQLYFEVYTGRDLTTRQTNRPPVIFSIPMENLQNTKEYRSQSEFKNIAYVYTDDGTHDWGVGPSLDPALGVGYINGVDRRILLLKTTIPEGYTGNVWEYLRSVGRKYLSTQKRQGFHIFEGEINQNNAYTYGEDYELGDVVELRNRDGEISYKHVTEQIFVSDLNGERSYPSLSIGRFDEHVTWKTYDDPQYGAYTWEDFQWSSASWDQM